MNKSHKDGAALILAGIIVLKAVFNIIFPGVRPVDTVEAYFERQMEVLAAIGSSISDKGITTAVTEVFSQWDREEKYPVYTVNHIR